MTTTQIRDEATWVIEPGVFPAEKTNEMEDAVTRNGCRLVIWRDEWWGAGFWPKISNEQPIIFHGSLNNASKIVRWASWSPGAYCKASAFECSAWYHKYGTNLLNRNWASLTLHQIVNHPESTFRLFGHPEKLFFRPESPLKPYGDQRRQLSRRHRRKVPGRGPEEERSLYHRAEGPFASRRQSPIQRQLEKTLPQLP